MSTVADTQRSRPIAVGSDLQRFWNLTWTLAVTDFKLRFYGSTLGYLWTLVRPFLFFGVVYFVFTEIAGLDANVENYGVYILFALVLFGFFSESTSGCVRCLAVRESLLRKMRFPRMVIPLSVVMTAVLNLGGTLAAVVIFAIASGVYPTWSWLELIPLIGLVAAFATGLGLLLSSLFVRYRDVQPIWEVVAQMLFYISPILYVTTLVPEEYRDYYLLNPLALLMTEMRAAVVDPSAPHPWDIADGALLLIPLGLIFAALALGWIVFSRQAPRIAEEL
ncbi:MAG TPA: ABC transporter permease [Solirubrobacteraceae bacterium]|nr:ABC transporter permease [Solirubrobacteraceae bacterium]